jgi:hypothetical protein
MKAQEVLTANFWREFGSMADTDGYHAVLLALEDLDAVEGYSKITYSDLPLWDWLEDYSDLKRAELAYTVCGHAVGKVAESLAKNYDPLENFFTDGTSDTDYGKTVTKNGKEITTPSGTITNSRNGEHEVENEGFASLGQSTTYDDADSSVPSPIDSADSSLVNVGRNINKGKTKETFNNYTDTTSYTNYKVEKEYSDVAEVQSGTDSTEEHRSGNSGIFSKQDLTQREINLRLRNLLVPIIVRQVVDVFNSGVWQ